jgi:hypothetical protein
VLQAAYDAFRRYILRVKANPARRNYSESSIQIDDTEIIVTEARLDGFSQSERIRWDEVARVFAYKKDCFAIDQIRMELFNERESSVLITEEMSGWDGLVQALPAKLPGCQRFEDWFPKVAFPAFVENKTLLYDRRNSLRKPDHKEIKD